MLTKGIISAQVKFDHTLLETTVIPPLVSYSKSESPKIRIKNYFSSSRNDMLQALKHARLLSKQMI